MLGFWGSFEKAAVSQSWIKQRILGGSGSRMYTSVDVGHILPKAVRLIKKTIGTGPGEVSKKTFIKELGELSRSAPKRVK